MSKHTKSRRGCGVLLLLPTVVLFSTALADGAPSRLTLRAGVTDAAQTQESTPPTTASSPTTPSSHPAWVKDIESKTWTGFLTGMSGYEDFVMPVGMPVYFEDPFITTDVRLLYIYHTIPHRSALRGEQVHAAAAQIRVALTDRLAWIATKDGYSWVDNHITPAGEGWNDFAVGLKYAL